MPILTLQKARFTAASSPVSRLDSFHIKIFPFGGDGQVSLTSGSRLKNEKPPEIGPDKIPRKHARYSRLIGLDEEGTLMGLNTLKQEVIEPAYRPIAEELLNPILVLTQ